MKNKYFFAPIKLNLRYMNILGLLLFFVVLSTWGVALFILPIDIHQGEVYRIIYLHVPCAFSAFMCSFLLCLFSLISLFKQNHNALMYAKSCCEVGLLFTLLTLTTGSIWGHPTWGTWWTWDARLTTTFLLAILFAGYLVLWSATDDIVLRNKACSILGVLIFADVPIIYLSVNWWRTLHQPPSLFSQQGSVMSSVIKQHLLWSLFAMVLFSLWLVWQRKYNLSLAAKLDKKIMENIS